MTNEFESNKKTLIKYLEKAILSNKFLNEENKYFHKEYLLKISFINNINTNKLKYEIKEIEELINFISDNFNEYEFRLNINESEIWIFVKLDAMDIRNIIIERMNNNNNSFIKFIERVILF